MNQKILDEEKENFIHSNYHEKNIIERHSYFLKFKDALQQGNRIAALEYFEKIEGNVHQINHLYTPKEENMKVLHNQLVSLNSLVYLTLAEKRINPIYLHIFNRHYDIMIEKMTTPTQAKQLKEMLIKDCCEAALLTEFDSYTPVIRDIIYTITAHPSQKLQLRELAKKHGLSISSLTRKFKTETGQTLSQYQTALRITLAKNYLLEGEYSITQIAYLLGYNDASYFTKVFTRETNMTPKAYMKHFT